MFEHFTLASRSVVVDAQLQARRMGHDYLGCEHLLFGVCSSTTEAGTVLRAAGTTPEAVEATTRRLVGGPFESLDRDALASVGIDLDLVRTKVEAAFGAGALNPTRRRGRRWRRRRCSDTGSGHLRLTERAKQCLELSLREARSLGCRHIDVEHLALALLSMSDGLARPILSQTADLSTAQLRSAILDRYRAAG